jgi:hypothetical protein
MHEFIILVACGLLNERRKPCSVTSGTAAQQPPEPLLNLLRTRCSTGGRFSSKIVHAVSEGKRKLERTQLGKSVARMNPDFKDGRPRKFTDAQIQLALDLLGSGKSNGLVQKMTSISKSTLIRAKRERGNFTLVPL